MQDDKNICASACWDCRHSCQLTLFSHCLPHGNAMASAEHVKLMTDCIAACQLTADLITRDSPHYMLMCKACAEICDDCAKSCEKFNDEIMNRCADICRRCAEVCRSLSDGI